MTVSAHASAVFDRGDLQDHTVSFFRHGWPTLPDIRLVHCRGLCAVVKDWSSRGALRRFLQGRFMLAREEHFLSRLRGLPGIPRCFGRPDADSLAIEFLDGRPVSVVHPHEYPIGYWDRLDALVRAIHERGVAHGDLDQEDNILVLSDGSPALIDFGNAITQSRCSPLHRLLFDLLRRHDLWCIERLRLKKDLFTGLRKAPPPPRLYGWQRRILLVFNKMERREHVRTHGVGQAP